MEKKTLPILGNNKAFTLVELLVALAMASLVITAMMSLTDMASRSYRNQERVSDAQQGVRGGIDAMVRDIRMAGYDPMAFSNGPTTDVGVAQATATSFRLTADVNADRAITDNMGDREEITFSYNPATGRLSQIRYETVGDSNSTVTETLVDNVSALTFTYFDEDGNVTAILSDIVLVVVNMTVTATDSEGGTYDRSLVTRINCRNLRF